MIDTAIILAGGLGTRLKPLTDTSPKPLLPIKGKPIIYYHLQSLKKAGIKKVILSIGYRAEKIRDFFQNGEKYNIPISYAFENEPLGTGGAVKQAAANLKGPFILVWGDNLMDINYTVMIKEFNRLKSPMLMALTLREDVENFGVARLNNGKIESFVEKPKREDAPSNLINAGAFILNPEILNVLPEGRSSIEKDCFEKIAVAGKIDAFIHQGQWYPTDTLEKYHFAEQSFEPPINVKEKKFIIADVDETICESCQQISPAMAVQVESLIKKGYDFGFISGTDAKNLAFMISSRITEKHHLLATTGTCYVQKENGGSLTVYQHIFKKEEAEEIIAALEKLISHFNIQSLTTKEDQVLNRESQVTFSSIGRKAPSEMKATFDPDGSKRKVWVEFLKQCLNEDKYDFKIGGTTSIDITRKGMNKAWGIKEFAKYHHLPYTEILFFGDKLYPGGNDYSALEVVDCISVKNPEDTLNKLKALFP